MAAQTHAMVVRHAHVAFSRLLLSCERLVAADPVGVADDDFDVDGVNFFADFIENPADAKLARALVIAKTP